MYKKRQLEQALIKCSQTFPVVMLVGSRQAGKTTLMRTIDPLRKFVTLDDLDIRRLAKEDPKLFLERFGPPVFIDEFQYAPNLLPYIKILVDEKRTKMQSADGDFWLSGSQNFKMMDGVSESLAGRVAILQILGFGRSEIEESHREFDRPPFFSAHNTKFETNRGMNELFEYIVRGDKPEVWTKPELDKNIFYSSYIQTYLERDVRSQINVKDIGLFEKFMRLLAARSGSLLNMATLASDVGVSQPTIKSWITVLERSYQIYMLRPYYSGYTKRIVKTPKVYFLDTGLLAHLLGIYDAVSAARGAISGLLFETWVVSEIIKSYWHRGLDPNIYFWRVRDGAEVDLVHEEGGSLFPAEIKMSASPPLYVFDAISKIKGKKLGYKRIICMTKQNLPIKSDAEMVSAWSIA